MDEYIGKDQVIEWFRPYGHVDEGIPYYGLVTDIREMKTADVAPVVHGRWEDTGKQNDIWTCSACGAKVGAFLAGFSAYFYHCGAKMDGGTT